MKTLFATRRGKARLAPTIAIALFLGFVSVNAADEQSLVVQARTGGESVHTLSGLRRITFAGGTMSVADVSQSDYPLADTQKLLFALRNTTTTGTPNAAADLDIAVYLNPATDELRIDAGELKIDNVQIVDLYGRTVVGAKYFSPTDGINVSALPAGLYIIKINTPNNGIITKKIIKQ